MDEHFYISSTKYSLQERQTKKHGKVYDVIFRIICEDGTEKQKKLSGFPTKTSAKQAYTDFVTQYCEVDKNIRKKKKNTTDVHTVGELLELYVNSLQNQNKDSSIYDKTAVYRLFVLPKYRNSKITDLTKQELYRWQDELWATKNPKTNDYYSYKYLSKIRSHFQAFLQWCESRYSYPNNLAGMQKPKRRTQKTQMQIWTREEFEQFLSVVDEPLYHCLFTLLFFTGRRKGEIFALTPDDVKANTINFNKSVTRKTIDGSPYKVTGTKADKSQLIPICDTVKNELSHYKGDAPFFFGGDVPIAENTLRRVFNSYCERAGVKHIRIHDLRHSFVSMLIHLGANFMVIADLIGDTVEQVTKTYGHMYESDKMEIISRLK